MMRRDWRTASLHDVVTKLVDGSHNPPAKQERGFPMLSARNVENGQIVFDQFRYIEEAAFERENSRTRVGAGDVLLTIVGTIGRTAVVPAGHKRFALQRSVAVLSPKAELLPKFLCYQLQAPTVQRYFEENARGTAQKGVYLKTLGATPISLPSLDTQEGVVAEIEKQFSRVDKAVANLRRVKANLRHYKASVLKSAVEGRLVECEASVARREGRTYETGEQLLQRVLATKDSQRKRREGCSTSIAQRSNLPEGWTSASIEQLSAFSFYGPRFSSDAYSDCGAFVLRTTDIEESGRVNTESAPMIDLSEQDLARYRVQVGDLLVTRTGSLGTVALFEDTVDAIPGAYLIQFRLVLERASRKFLFFYLTSPEGQARLTGAGAGVGRPNLNAPTVSEMTLGFPPLCEQARIVAEVDRRLSIIRELEAEVDANLRRAQSLRQAVLAKQFSGG